MHQPLDPQAILLRHAAENQAATDFLRFLRDDDARQIIRAHGYRVPE
jgi:molybdate transport system substrate-binding protein